MTSVQKHIVSDDDAGQRLDRWFFKHFPDVPKTHLYKLMRKGQIRINSKRVKPDTRIETGQEIRIPPIQSKGLNTQKTNISLSKKDQDYYRSLVLYEDDDLLAFNKPVGLAVQGGSKISHHLDGILPLFQNKKNVVPRLVHRLDRDTSGVVILAKSAQVARYFGTQFKTQKVEKIYQAITSPAPQTDVGDIKAPLAKGTGPDKQIMGVDPKNGKYARTLYKVMDKASDDFAHVCFSPLTGRTHQIRVHAAHLGCPLLGDHKYGGETNFETAFDHQYPIQKRLYLHASMLRFIHPSSKKPVIMQAPLNKQDEQLWAFLGFDPKVKRDIFETIKI